MKNSHKKRLRKKTSPKYKYFNVSIDSIPIEDFTIANLPFKYCKLYCGDMGMVLNRRIHVKLSYLRNSTPDSEPTIVEFNIHKHFTWDGASIPTFIQWLIGGKLNPSFIIASLLHDYAIEDNLLDHLPESHMFYVVLNTRRGMMDIPWYKEKAMFAGVYTWSLLGS
jgi:hypothetical protein